MLGPIFQREYVVLPRRAKHFVARLIFVAMLFSIVCTTWLLLAGIQLVRNVGDYARFGTLVFQFLAPLQLCIVAFVAALAGANAVAHEKDRKTLVLLLMTSLTNREFVLGKISAGVLPALNLFLSGLPVLVLVTLFGGVSVSQVLAVGWITATTILACGALGATVAFWREKTFQAIAVTLLAIVLWLTFCELIHFGFVPYVPPIAASFLNPARGVWVSCQPIPAVLPGLGAFGVAWVASGTMMLIAIGLTATSISFLRIWNPSREARPTNQEDENPNAARVAQGDNVGEGKRTVQVWKSRRSKQVWNNPVLWREVCTWAYGRKVLIIRFAYLLFVAIAAIALHRSIESGQALGRSVLAEELIPEVAKFLGPLFVVSLVIINALAVNSITNERDGQAIDLLMVTEITPFQFLVGKIVGVAYVAKEILVLPLALCVYLWWRGGVSSENLIFTMTTLIVLDIFVIALGIHCGMIYAQSRHAIAVSLATVFFLFLGVVTCMLIMISFRGSFGRQLAPFLAIILGGGTGLYMALGHRNPSPAITLAAFSLPFLTFFAITSFILRDQEMTVCSVLTVAYGFTTAAMLVPALSEFDFATTRSKTVEEG